MSEQVETLKEAKRRLILEAYKRNFGVINRAARELGMGRTTLYRKLKEYGVVRETRPTKR